jgi:hypothetical protein
MKTINNYQQFLRELSKLDELETFSHRINRSDSTSKKQIEARAFSTKVLGEIKDERDVILIAVKIK